MSQIKYIFRDFWWVVAKLDKKKSSYLSQMAIAYQLPREDISKIASPYISQLGRWAITENKFWKIISQKIGVPTPQMVKMIFHQPLESYAKLNTSIIRFVSKLQKLGYICIVLSDDNVPQSLSLKKSGRYKQFDDVLISCDIKLSKYSDRITGTDEVFTYVLKKYNLTPSEMIFIDDVAENCVVAKRLKIKTVLAQTPMQVIRDIKKILHSS